MSGGAFKNLEDSLRKHLPEAELKEVKRILYGRSDEWVFFALQFKLNVINMIDNHYRNIPTLREREGKERKRPNGAILDYTFDKIVFINLKRHLKCVTF